MTKVEQFILKERFEQIKVMYKVCNVESLITNQVCELQGLKILKYLNTI